MAFGLTYFVVSLATLSLCLCHRSTIASGLQASFYGDSYVRVPVQDASSSTDIKLHFRTSSPSGLLMLAAGTTDYCKVLIQSGAVQATLDLGTGEAILVSPPGLVFNDLQWHSVHLVRVQSRVTLTIDGIYSSEAITPGRFFELNIDRDLFIGGTGAFDGVVFFGNFRSFRGCLRNVSFNGIDVLKTGHEQSHSLYVYAVTWDCAAEFGATSDQPISFTRSTSYVAFPSLETRQEGRLTFDLRTRSEFALLVYNSGTLVDSDFIAVEIVNGHLKLRVNKGSGAVALTTERVVNDGRWHQVEVVIDAVSARLTVDGQRKEERINFGGTRFLDVTTHLYVGGVGVVSRAVAVQKELDSLNGSRAAGGSLIGCVQNFKVDGRLLGFRDAVNSRDIRPECTWSFPCAFQPCADDAECIEEGFYDYRCQCTHSECYRNDSDGVGGSGIWSPPSTSAQDMLRVQDLVVKEGGKSVLSLNNIEFIDEERNDYDIRDSSVSFKVLDHPYHGEIVVDAGRRMLSRPVTFTMADLKDSKVWYNHDGSETSSDRVVLQLEFLSVQSSAPAQFRKKYRFTLMIQVAAWNDPPEIHLPPDNTLVLITSTQINITPRLINATDTDDPPSRLEYTVLYQQGFDVGFFELNDNLGARARITRFSQEDINDGKLSYVHRGLQFQQLRLQVSDGKDIGDPKILKISAVPLTISLVANTGLVVPRGSSRPLTRQNLTYTTNAPDQDIEVRYVVTDSPYDGEIQRQQYADNSWIVTSTFTQKHVDRGRVRYVHNGSSKAEGDYFSFKVTAMGVEMQQFEFHIRIVNLTVELMRSVGMTLRGVKERVLTSDELKAVSAVPDHGPSDVVFSILSLPRFGQLMRSEQRGPNRIQKRRLAVGSNFTQTDINDKLLSYKLLRTLTERTIDDFEFVVHIPGYTSRATPFQLIFESAEGDLLVLNNGLMDVVEGDSKPITREDLFVEQGNHDDFGYLITDGPHHGVVQLVGSNETRQTVATFTNDDIKNGRVFYKHDDSETEEDFFSFTALFERSDPDVREVSGNFDVKILLRNDNEPRRVVNRTFFVVANRGRVITLDDMQYVDPDVDFDSSTLMYEWRDIPNGYLVLREGTSLKNFTVSKFLQKDIADGLLYFKHNGANYSKSLVTVSDGRHFTSSLHEVLASDPFLKVSTDSVMFANCRQRAVLLASTFGVDTNLDVSDRSIRFIVLEPPSHGLLKLGDKDGQHFTLADVKNHLVVYEHDSSESMNDDFGYEVKVEDLVARGRTAIRVTQIVNRLAVVEEFESVTIGEQLLTVSSSQTTPADITYLVTSQPKYGSLALVNRREGTEHLLAFTQSDINLGRLRYDHTDDGHYSDAFHFDVRLDNISLTGQTFLLEIISTRGSMPFQLGNLTVLEGSSAYLTNDTFIFKSKTFENRDLDFIVLREPMYGRLQSVDVPLYPVMQFTLEHVRNRKILYIHDSSETNSDRLLLVARMNSDAARQSGPKILWITVQPSNDIPPRITVNKKLRVWQGSRAPIKRTNLLSEDADTRPEDLTYFISQPTNGDVNLLTSSISNDITVTNFTQADIDNNLVVFHHKVSAEASVGYFRFNISDGVNFLAQETFQIEVEPLLLTLDESGPLGVYPGLAQPLTNAVLRATTNDPLQPRPISYTLQAHPTHGRLVTSDLAEEVSTFSQEEIDTGAIYYRHNTTALVGHSLEDFISFDVSTVYASAIRSQTMSICISYESVNSDNRDQFVVVQGASVDEGEAVEISKASLDVTKYKKRLIASGLRGPEVYLVVRDLPVRGNLTLSGETLQPGDNLTQKEINRGIIVYQHDHSDTLADAFSFTLRVELTGRQPLRCNCGVPPLVITYNITVRPVNDQPFTLRTDTPSIELVQGSVCVITNRTLKTTDPDTDPGDIKYEINNMPNNGFIALSQSQSQDQRAVVGPAVYAFSQRDVDNDSVVFVHDGTPGNGAFYFSVSDGRHKPLFKVFNIRVTPLNLEVVSLTDVEILQGHFSSIVAATNVVLKTNARSQQITYNVTKTPVYGLLYLNDAISSYFSHRDIEEGLVAYVQTDFVSANDSFEFLVSDNVQNVIFNQRLSIVVRPYLKMGDRPVQVKGERSVRITIIDLDATELSIVTGSDPEYYVIRGPTRGRLFLIDSVKRVRREAKARKDKNKEATRSKNGRERTRSGYAENAVIRFTHDDIVNERVEYRVAEAHGTSAANDGQPSQDSFTFVLTARNAQPVTGTLRIDVIPSSKVSSGEESTGGNPSIIDMPSTSRSPAKITTISTAGEIGTNDSSDDSPEKVSKNHLLIVFLISGITVMALVGFVVFKCMRRRKTKKYDSPSAKKAEANISASATPAPAVPIIAITSSSSPDAEVETHPQRPTQLPMTATGEVFHRPRPATPRGRLPSRLERQEALIAESPPSSPTMSSKAGYVRIVPAQKDPITPDDQTTTTTPGGTIKKEQVIFDWENVDPELLQHCRKTNPILHKNQYWV